MAIIKRFFKTKPQAGKPIALKGLAAGLAAIERALGRMNVHNGHVDWKNGIPKIVVDAAEGGTGLPDYPFQILAKSANEITVLSGKWKRNGRITVAAETDLGPLSNGMHFIVVTLSHPTDNPEVNPDTCTIGVEALDPLADPFNIKTLLGTVVVSAGVIPADGIDQLWKAGDIDNTATLPDSDTSLVGAVILNSLMIRPDHDGIHEGEETQYGFGSLLTKNVDEGKIGYALVTDGVDTTYTWDHVIKYNGNGIIGGTAGATQQIETVTSLTDNGNFNRIDYTTVRREITDGREDIIDPGAGGSFDLTVDFDTGTITGDIAWAGGGVNPYTLTLHHDETYPDQGADPHPRADWNANPDQDGRYFYATAAAYNVGTGPGINDADFHTTGEVHADVFQIQDALTNFWNAEGFTADVTGDIDLLAGVDMNIQTVVGAMSLDAGTTLDLDSGGAMTLTPEGLFHIVASDGVDVDLLTGFDMRILLGAADDLFNVKTGVYAHDDVPGVTLADGDANNLWSGGCFVNVPGYVMHVLQGVRVQGIGGVINLGVLGKVL